EQHQTMVEFADQIPGVLVQRLVVNAGLGNVEVEDRRQNIEQPDETQGHFTDRVDPGFNHREVESEQLERGYRLDQHAADDHTENDRADGQPLDPAVGDDE